MHIIAIIAVAICFGVAMVLVSDVETYKTFASAKELPDGKSATIIGKLTSPDDVHYDPEMNPNLTTFLLEDKEGMVMKVKYFEPMPRDFEKSDEVTITGTISGEEFHASKLLMKCPSKYVEEGIQEYTSETS